MAKNRFLGFGSVIVAIAAGLLSPALADEGLQTIRGAVKVYEVESLIDPCPPPKAMLTVPDREPLLLRGDASVQGAAERVMGGVWLGKQER